MPSRRKKKTGGDRRHPGERGDGKMNEKEKAERQKKQNALSDKKYEDKRVTELAVENNVKRCNVLKALQNSQTCEKFQDIPREYGS